MLKWKLAELGKFQKTPLEVDTTEDLATSLQTRFEEILAATPFKIKATLTFDDPVWLLDAHVQGTVTVPSTRSLTPVKWPIDQHFTEVYVTDDADAQEFEEDEVVLSFEDEVFDLQKAIEDNIILSLPTQILTPEEAQANLMPKGKDWDVISENDYQKQVETDPGTPNPEFEKLKNLFNEDHQDKG
ncbi:MAG: DUF177 domain-containing protein [Lactobacillus sp.]|nr:DUF177 domain-containing protein [Lactobacillus sp.]